MKNKTILLKEDNDKIVNNLFNQIEVVIKSGKDGIYNYC